MVDATTLIEQLGSEVVALEGLSRALSLATESRLMSQEHGGAVWKKYLKDRGFDVPRPTGGKIEVGTKEEVKK